MPRKRLISYFSSTSANSDEIDSNPERTPAPYVVEADAPRPLAVAEEVKVDNNALVSGSDDGAKADTSAQDLISN